MQLTGGFFFLTASFGSLQIGPCPVIPFCLPLGWSTNWLGQSPQFPCVIIMYLLLPSLDDETPLENDAGYINYLSFNGGFEPQGSCLNLQALACTSVLGNPEPNALQPVRPDMRKVESNAGTLGGRFPKRGSGGTELNWEVDKSLQIEMEPW